MTTHAESAVAVAGPAPAERYRRSSASRLNWLRAGVLGANDGIVSVAAIVVGVSGATPATAPILTAGVAGLVGGAISMALGEYVSVSSQSDSQRAAGEPDVVSAWHAALASAVAFTLGALLPLAAILLGPADIRVPVTFAAVLLALALTGATAARIGNAPVVRATARVVIGGAAALAATFLIGSLLGASGIV
jgi:VIT1/CCC1 family predicted Fe2+/Mn2+ transporter